MNNHRARCLILSCGNTLREDDGVGPWLSLWAESRFAGHDGVVILARHQWTPDLAADLAEAETAVFIDCSIDAAPGEVRLESVEAAASDEALGTHHMGAAELLALAKDLYSSLPRRSLMLTIGAGSMELGEQFSPTVQAALPEACRRLAEAVEGLLASA
jgi:hydrogenase maturation protease